MPYLACHELYGESNVIRKERICWVLPLLLASSGAAWADTDVTIYGYADVSVDEVNNGIKSQPFVTSNSSYLGFGAQHDITSDLKIVGQFETQVDIAATPSIKDSLGYRNSFLGFASKSWGAIKGGKSDTPYKTATASFDPFANTIGDYNSIMGNTGGGFGDLYSGSAIFKLGGFLGIAAAELHHAVNRESDGVPNANGALDEFGNPFIVATTEWAAKIGAGYDFGPVKLYAVGEYMRKTGLPAAFNERT